MTTLYTELRKMCSLRGITQDDIAKRLSRSRGYVSARFCGADPWEQADMYTIMDMIHEPHRKLHLYFPPGGIWAGSAEDPPPSVEQQMLTMLKQFVRENAS